MPWLSNPQRDSRDDIRAAQQALVYAGYPHAEAVSQVSTHLGRVRAATSTRGTVTVAGFLTGALMAVIAVAALVVAILVSGVVSSTVHEPGMPLGCPPGLGLRNCPSHVAAPAFDNPGAPLGSWPAIAIGSPILGLAGAWSAHITRNRWRRAGAAYTFSDLAPRRVYLVEIAVLGLTMAGLVVGVVWAFAGSQFSEAAFELLALIAIPVGAAVFAAAFPALYAWVLPRVSPLNAAAFARPIIERDAALQVVADREFYGRSPYHRSRSDRTAWADAVLHGQGFATTAARQEALRRRMDRGSGAYSRGVPLWQRLWRYILITGAVAVPLWGLSRWVAWILGTIHDPLALAPLVDVVGWCIGTVVGIAVTWVYARNLEGL
ncbi:MAG: hypothetical protein OXG64_04530 [Chloroflexi bacterium]|nr:hypothetical protein [Chloroflexota bacterium]